MTDLSKTAEQLFNKIRGQFPKITIGDKESNTTLNPTDARLFEFDYTNKDSVIGKCSCTLDDDGIVIMYSDNLVGDESDHVRQSWYNFLQGMRKFARNRMLNFEVRNINKDMDRRSWQEVASNQLNLPESIDIEEYIENL